ncbi:hypothetical protein DZE40_004146 [Clostridium beijerinckii]|nr:hypothetical protein [Clostridium beijerinckii]
MKYIDNLKNISIEKLMKQMLKCIDELKKKVFTYEEIIQIEND